MRRFTLLPVLLLLFSMGGIASAQDNVLDNRFEHHTTFVGDGVRIHYVIGGEGPPLLLLHGWPESWYLWHELMPDLANQYTVIAPDMPGYGDSSTPVCCYDFATVSGWLHELIEQLGYEEISIASHDLGAGVAYVYAATYPDEVSHLAVMDMIWPGLEIPDVGSDLLLTSWWWNFHLQEDIPEVLIPGNEEAYLRWFYSNLAYDPSAVSDNFVDVFATNLRKPGVLTSSLEYYRTYYENAEIIAELSQTQLPMPVLALGGERSAGDLSLISMQLVAENVTGGTIEGAGHWVIQEQPAVVLEELLTFLSEEG